MLMLSGRYRTEMLARHWSANKSGYCQTQSCKDLEHILAGCPSLEATRSSLLDFTKRYHEQLPQLHYLKNILWHRSHPSFCQLILDCSILPSVIKTKQQYGPEIYTHLFRITRTWCYCLHKERLKILGRWQHF